MGDTKVHLDPVRQLLDVQLAGQNFRVNQDGLHSVFYRRPVFLRSYGDDERSALQRFSEIQWAVLFRSLMVFDRALWVNSPVETYRAEHKVVQLAAASKLGFNVPETRITNAPTSAIMPEGTKEVAVKGLDTVLVRENGQETFGFTTLDNLVDLEAESWDAAPATIQSALGDKLDIRVTVVEEDVFAASIMVDGKGVEGDWRTQKKGAKYVRHELPAFIADLCVELVEVLGLKFGAIDLALCGGDYFFLEINPTGEWGWLVDTAGLAIDEAITNVLVN